MTDRNPYSQRRNVLSKQDKLRFNKWAAQPSKQQDGKIDRIALWQSLHSFVVKRDGRIISPPGTYPIRLETPPDSELPDKLRELGYTLVSKGTETRVGGPASPEYQARWRQGFRSPGHGFFTVHIHEVDLPRNLPNPASKAALPVV